MYGESLTLLAFALVLVGCDGDSNGIVDAGVGGAGLADRSAVADAGGLGGEGGIQDASMGTGRDATDGDGAVNDGNGLCTDPERCGCDYRPNRDFRSAIPDCSCEYDLRSFDGDTNGLCPAVASMYCMCDEFPATDYVVCAPDGSACYRAGGCPRADEICGWVVCWPEEPDGGCPASSGLLDELVDAAASGTLPDERALRLCAADDDCPPGKTCSLRAANRMFCQ